MFFSPWCNGFTAQPYILCPIEGMWDLFYANGNETNPSTHRCVSD